MTTTTTFDAIKRRPVGKALWKVTVQELLESERTTLQYLRSIANSHPNDSEIQRLVSNATHESATRILQLTELLHYRDDNQTQNGTHP